MVYASNDWYDIEWCSSNRIPINSTVVEEGREKEERRNGEGTEKEQRRNGEGTEKERRRNGEGRKEGISERDEVEKEGGRKEGEQ